MITDYYLSGPLSDEPPAYAGGGALGDALRGFLARWNGVFAYTGAFVILPSGPCRDCWSMEEVNAGAWKAAYPEPVRNTWYFAVDALGHPFGIREEAVVRLDPETGTLAHVHDDWEGFLASVGADPDRMARLQFFEAWLAAGNTLGLRERISPRVPFSEGGGRTIDHLRAEDLMRMLARHAARHAHHGGGASDQEG